MKSDIATIESRRNRLLELLAEGKSQVEAAEILESEGFPADKRTVQRDVKFMKADWQNSNLSELDRIRQGQLELLQKMREELEFALLRPDRKYDLLLGVLDREISLLGTKAPTKSFNVSASMDVDPEQLVGYRKFVSSTRSLTPGQLEEVYGFIKSLPVQRTQIEAHFPQEESDETA
jgi:hypothetical protein